jgi:transposase
MHSQETKDKIKQSSAETRNKRKSQQQFTRELKIDMSKLNQASVDYFSHIFDEVKWIKNNAIQNGIFTQPTNLKQVPIRYVNDSNEIIEETRPIQKLQSMSQMSAVDELKIAVRSLATRKSHGHRIGKINYIKEVNNINYLRYDMGFKFKRNDNDIITHIKLAKNKQWLKVSGGKQLVGVDELPRISLVRKPSGLYIKIVCCIANDKFEEWKASFSKTKIDKKLPVVGCDLGIKTTISISDNQQPRHREELNIKFPVTNSIKHVQRKLAKSLAAVKKTDEYKKNHKYRSKNYIKLIQQYRLEYEKLTNKRKTKAKQFVAYLTRRYEMIVFQDESISGWAKGLFGRAIQFSALGTIKSELKQLVAQNRAIMISSSVATTQLCPKCNKKTKHPLSKRTYHCDHCGFEDHRDYKAADMMYVSAGFRYQMA